MYKKLNINVIKSLQFIALIFAALNVKGQVPVIDNFSPEMGPVGTTVTINGTNFDADPAKNAVFFGAVRAKVVTASNNVLTIIVPPGTSYMPISVTANGLIGCASRPFILTYSFIGEFGANSFRRGDFGPRISPGFADVTRPLAVKDLDNDGRAEVVTGGITNVIIYKNSSSPLQPELNVGLTLTAEKPYKLTVEDVNGDGKPDIISPNLVQKTVSVFINTSMGNQLSFDPAVNYPVGNDPYGVCVTDLNGDGKPDIAVVNSATASSSISVLTNNTPSGGPLLFLPAKNFAMPGEPRDITAGDVDLDGKPDLVVTCQAGYVSVLRNTSTINNINFSAPANLPAFEGSPESALITDFDNDQKPDIAVSVKSANKLVILKNISSGGNLSFTNDLQLPVTHSYNSYAGDLDGDGKLDMAVTNFQSNSVALNLNKGPVNNFVTIAFDDKVDLSHGQHPRNVIIADIDLDGRPDIVTANLIGFPITVYLNSIKKQSVISFPPPTELDIDAYNYFHPNATSNNNETGIVYTTSNPSIAYIDAAGNIVILAPGTVTITANQAETQNFLSAAPVSQTFTFTQLAAITAEPIGPKAICDQDFQINVTSTSPRPFFYYSSSQSVAKVSSTGMVHIVGPGRVTIGISQPGKEMFEDVAPVYLTFDVLSTIAPVVTVSADKSVICAGSQVTYAAAVTAGGDKPVYKWYLNGIITGNNSALLTLINVLATDRVKCEVTADNLCQTTGTSDEVIINVQPLTVPSISIQTVGGPFCTGSSVAFTATTANKGTGATYQWRVNNVLVSTTTVPNYTHTGLADNDKVTCILTVSSSGSCATVPTAVSNELIINLLPAEVPQVVIAASEVRIYSGKGITFTATVSKPVSSYQWKVNNVNFGTNSPKLTTALLNDGDKVTCKVTAADVCALQGSSNEVIISVLQLSTIYIPNAFTPNADGVNDTWQIPELASFSDYVVNIFDRSGSILYQSKGYATAWDGTFKGKKLPTGTYYYLINTPVSKDKRSGYVTIIR